MKRLWPPGSNIPERSQTVYPSEMYVFGLRLYALYGESGSAIEEEEVWPGLAPKFNMPLYGENTRVPSKYEITINTRVPQHG